MCVSIRLNTSGPTSAFAAKASILIARLSPDPFMSSKSTSTGSLWHPRYWPTWIALGALRIFEPLPFFVLVWLGRRIGDVMLLMPLSFVKTARRNLELCLPELSASERQRILREHFRSIGIGLFETAMAWWSPDERIRK